MINRVLVLASSTQVVALQMKPHVCRRELLRPFDDGDPWVRNQDESQVLED